MPAAITGTINRDRKQYPSQKRDSTRTIGHWTLHLEGGADAARVVLDGKFENLTWLARSLTSTYTQGNHRGTFKITGSINERRPGFVTCSVRYVSYAQISPGITT